MISTLTNLGTLRLMVYAGALNAVMFLRFLYQLLRHELYPDRNILRSDECPSALV
jgi:hypothetical protein